MDVEDKTDSSTDPRRQLCNTLLHKLIRTPRKMEKWWDRPNEAFKLKTPNQVWQTTPHLVVDYLLHKAMGSSKM